MRIYSREYGEFRVVCSTQNHFRKRGKYLKEESDENEVGGKLAIVGHHYGTVAIEGYFHFKTCRFCVKKSISVPLATVMAKNLAGILQQ
jgi:hypothetical protein